MIAAAGAAFDNVLDADPSEFPPTLAVGHQERFQPLSSLRDFAERQFLSNSIDLAFGLAYLGFVALHGGWLVVIPVAAGGVVIATAVLITPQLRQSVRIKFDACNSTRFGVVEGEIESISPTVLQTDDGQACIHLFASGKVPHREKIETVGNRIVW